MHTVQARGGVPACLLPGCCQCHTPSLHTRPTDPTLLAGRRGWGWGWGWGWDSTLLETKHSARTKNDGVWSRLTSRRAGALDAALVLDYLTTREDHCLCDRDGNPTCTHVAQSVCPQVPYDMHTRTAISACGCAQLELPSRAWRRHRQKKSHGRGRHQRCILHATCDV